MSRKRAEQWPGETRRRALACSQGTFYVVSGAWPVVHLPSFQWVFGPKADEWLVETVSGLLMTVGSTQIRGRSSPEGRDLACLLGVGTAATLMIIDVVYVPRGRLKWTYLIDAVVEAAWIAAWLSAGGSGEPANRRNGRKGRRANGRNGRRGTGRLSRR